MPNWKKLITSGSDALLNKLNVTNGITGSLFGSASWSNNSLTASYVNTLDQSVIISGSTLSIIPTTLAGTLTENVLIIGPASSSLEGGQILLQAPGGTYTSASMWDNYTNKTRLLRGTNASSDAEVATWNMHSKQMQLPAYNSLGAFTGTPVAALGVNSNGDVITIQTGSQAGGSGVTINNNTDNYILTATGTANTINGESSLTFNGSTLAVTGNVTATSFTGSLQGTATSATSATNATNAQNINVKSGPGSAKWYVPFTNGLDTYAQPYGAESFKFDTSIGLAEVTSSYALSASLVATIRDTTSNTFYPTLVNSDNSPASYEQLYTTSNISIKPGLGLITATAVSATSLTGSLQGTASYANNALSSSYIQTASYALNSLTASYALNGGGSGASPSGNQWNVQVNSGSGQFYADTGFTYNPVAERKITWTHNRNFSSSYYDQNANGAIQITSVSSSVSAFTYSANITHIAKLLPSATTTVILGFDVQNSVNTHLKVNGFKCDYSIAYLQSSPSVAISDTRTGTLMAAWSWDQAQLNITDTNVVSDLNGLLQDGVFSIAFNGTNIELSYDPGPNIAADSSFSGLFTIFSNK